MSSEHRQTCKLCDKSHKLVRTECCNQWLCNEEADHNLYDNGRPSCFKNHEKYTLCAYHHKNGHEGDWKTCQKCKEGFKTEMYVWHSTNKYNFEKLQNPPQFQPTHCSGCSCVIRLGEDCYVQNKDGYSCFRCSF